MKPTDKVKTGCLTFIIRHLPTGKKRIFLHLRTPNAFKWRQQRHLWLLGMLSNELKMVIVEGNTSATFKSLNKLKDKKTSPRSRMQ